MALNWKVEHDAEGVRIRCRRTGLLRSAKTVPVSEWEAVCRELPGANLLLFLVGERSASDTGDAVLVPHDGVAALDESQAEAIGLPPAIPHALQLRSRGTIDEQGFSICARWLRFGNTPIGVSVEGAIASEGGTFYRIPSPLFQLIGAVNAFNSAGTATRETRVILWQPIQDLLERMTDEPVKPDGYLEDLRIFHAASLSLASDLHKERQGMDFHPVLFGRTVRTGYPETLTGQDPEEEPPAASDDGSTVAGVDTLVDEASALLTNDLQAVFRKRFDRDDACRETYPLGSNTFVYIDPRLRKALDVVKAKQHAGGDERRAFVKNPRQAFANALGEGENSAAIRSLFVETQQYAEWIQGVELWQPRVLPWLQQSSTSWVPEKIGFTIDGKIIEVKPESLPKMREACADAVAAGQGTFDFEDLSGLPATPETLDTIERLQELSESDGDGNGDEGDGSNREDTHVIKADDNIEALLLELGLAPRRVEIDRSPPKESIKPVRLLPHQREGFDWLIDTWAKGRPGVLLADDMGLGKTIQALVFAAWLRANSEKRGISRQGPILIVAPTALLKNWRKEHDTHLSGKGVGPIVELYGSQIQSFKTDISAGRDVVEGHGVLNDSKLRATSCILTTYETLANYHFSFARIRYPLVIFDEVQKLKTPTTINTHAAKTLNIDFAVGLTGTPVENNLSELWSIMDRLHPGFLKDLRSFNATYSADNRESLERLADELKQGGDAGVAIMLRRMKGTTDLGRALPDRKLVPLVRDMPDNQANAYEEVISRVQAERAAGKGRATMLEALRRMRGISLHPDHPSKALGRIDRHDDYIRESARLSVVAETLDKINASGEKALVFIEHREMQRTLVDILRHRFGLSDLPAIINGGTPSAQRHALVTRFQDGPRGQFDVMILSPRAAGVGLNITAANHVIHLSRWWNPAVEDQCNDRVYRIGQDKPVTIYLPIARHPQYGDSSFDVKLDNLLARKRSLSRELLAPVESEGDFDEIFKATTGVSP